MKCFQGFCYPRIVWWNPDNNFSSFTSFWFFTQFFPVFLSLWYLCIFRWQTQTTHHWFPFLVSSTRSMEKMTVPRIVSLIVQRRQETVSTKPVVVLNRITRGKSLQRHPLMEVLQEWITRNPQSLPLKQTSTQRSLLKLWYRVTWRERRAEVPKTWFSQLNIMTHLQSFSEKKTKTFLLQFLTTSTSDRRQDFFCLFSQSDLKVMESPSLSPCLSSSSSSCRVSCNISCKINVLSSFSSKSGNQLKKIH